MPNYKCKLLPHERTDVLSLQEVKQSIGWEISAFDLPNAWKHTQGEGVTVAVLDSGVDSKHPDLSDNLLTGYNVLNPSKKPEDGNGHGSHCSGIICAQNNAIGMVGVAPKAKVLPVKVLDDKGNGNVLDVAKGVRWAVDNGADLMCMSLGCPSPIQQLRKALQYAVANNVTVFCAAGNAGQSKLFYPAVYPETISVSAIDKNLKRADFANYAKNLDFFAPGVDIYSTVPKSWYAKMSGTSMASPWVTGIAALLLSYARKTNKFHLKTIDDFRRILKEYSTPIVTENFFNGFGLILPDKFTKTLEAS